MGLITETAGCTQARVIHLKPVPRLLPYVASIAVLDRRQTAANADQIYVLPDARATLLFHVNGLENPGRSSVDGNGAVVGGATQAYSRRVNGAPLTLVLTFKAAGAYALLSRPITDLRDRLLTFGDLWGAAADRLVNTLLRADSCERRLGILERYLCDRLEEASEKTLRRSQRVQQIHQLGRQLTDQALRSSLHGIAGRCGISPRNLRRLFGDVVGLNPAMLFRIERFNHAVRLATADAAPNWGDVACKCGYYDQPHLISDFQYFTRHTPTAFMAALRLGLPSLSDTWFRSLTR